MSKKNTGIPKFIRSPDASVIWCSCLDGMVELACTNDPDSYAGGSLATGRVTQADKLKERSQTKRNNLVLQVGGYQVRPETRLTENMSKSKITKANKVKQI